MDQIFTDPFAFWLTVYYVTHNAIHQPADAGTSAN